MRVVELLPFFNEIDILQARFALMTGVVDTHFLAEGDLTHQGEPKPSYSLGVAIPGGENAVGRLFELPADEGETANWARERAQRDALAVLLDDQLDLNPDDLVLSCDLDEIVDPDAVPRIAEACTYGPVSLAMRMIYYGTREDPKTWIAAKAFRARHMPESLTTLRFGASPVVPDCGWHLSYLGDTERRRTKVEAFLHAENRPGTPAWDRIAEAKDGPNGEQLIDFDPLDLPVALRKLVDGSP